MVAQYGFLALSPPAGFSCSLAPPYSSRTVTAQCVPKRRVARGFLLLQAGSNATEEAAREEVACDEWEYEVPAGSGASVLMRWDMVCGRRWYEQLYRSAYMVGSVASVAPVALCSHQVGRQPMLRGCVLVLLASGLVAAAAPSVPVFIVARFFAAAAASALEVVSFVLLFESTPPAPRVAFCALAICWPMVLAPLYMAIAGLLGLDWRLYHMALLVPSLVLVAGLHATQESSHWLLVHGRFAEARGVALWAARVNDEDEDLVEARLRRYAAPSSRNFIAQHLNRRSSGFKVPLAVFPRCSRENKKNTERKQEGKQIRRV